jgi:large subunit ribosomal protein L22
MLITAEQRNSRQSDRKVSLVANSVKKLSIEGAFKQLAVMEKKASIVVMKVLRQAVANATHNHGLALADLKIQSILVNGGQMYKRQRAVSRGRGHAILKRTCHVKVILTTQATAVTTAVAPTDDTIKTQMTPKAAEPAKAVQVAQKSLKKIVPKSVKPAKAAVAKDADKA